MEESVAKRDDGDFLRHVCWRKGEFAGNSEDLGLDYVQEGCCGKKIQTMPYI